MNKKLAGRKHAPSWTVNSESQRQDLTAAVTGFVKGLITRAVWSIEPLFTDMHTTTALVIDEEACRM